MLPCTASIPVVAQQAQQGQEEIDYVLRHNTGASSVPVAQLEQAIQTQARPSDGCLSAIRMDSVHSHTSEPFWRIQLCQAHGR